MVWTKIVMASSTMATPVAACRVIRDYQESAPLAKPRAKRVISFAHLKVSTKHQSSVTVSTTTAMGSSMRTPSMWSSVALVILAKQDDARRDCPIAFKAKWCADEA